MSDLSHLSDEDLLKYYGLYRTMLNKNRRLDGLKKFNMDVKFAYHVVRLASQAQQILMEGDLNLEEPGRREHMKAIRRGEVSEADIREWFTSAERNLEQLYANSKLREKPDWDAIKALLLDVLRHHYGDLSEFHQEPGLDAKTMEQVGELVDRWRAQRSHGV